MEIDDEVRRIVMEGYGVATRLIDENMETLKTLAEALLERETLDATEVVMVVKGEELPAPPSPVEEEARRKPKSVLCNQQYQHDRYGWRHKHGRRLGKTCSDNQPQGPWRLCII